MRDLDKVRAALRGGRQDGQLRRLGCLVPAVLAIGAMVLPAIGAIVALEPIATDAHRSPQGARGDAQALTVPPGSAPRLLAPFTASYDGIARRAVPRA